MAIEQPRRQAGPQQAKRFHAICPYCTKLLIIIEGKWPAHERTSGMQCSTSLKEHGQ